MATSTMRTALERKASETEQPNPVTDKKKQAREKLEKYERDWKTQLVLRYRLAIKQREIWPLVRPSIYYPSIKKNIDVMGFSKEEEYHVEKGEWELGLSNKSMPQQIEELVEANLGKLKWVLALNDNKEPMKQKVLDMVTDVLKEDQSLLPRFKACFQVMSQQQDPTPSTAPTPSSPRKTA